MIISKYGDIAQLVEHLVRNQRVTGSNPAISIFLGTFLQESCKNQAFRGYGVLRASGASHPPCGHSNLLRVYSFSLISSRTFKSLMASFRGLKIGIFPSKKPTAFSTIPEKYRVFLGRLAFCFSSE